ncbi:flagellar basal body P-ring formation chaperone FlgA [Hwanghaeella sp.]|uniref:flagellar basal body P-ring formation chaperone FlgA n=1 Tax=Hwanghaeella sp. TaxID=2605943 RepID=UPI003CCBDB89
MSMTIRTENASRWKPAWQATLRAAVFGLAAFSVAVAATAWNADAAETKTAIAKPARLITDIRIAGDGVTLGDVFENAGPYADRVIARAPSPGQTATLEARWLGRVARAFGLDWRPTSRYDLATVTRLAHVIPSERITNELLNAIILRNDDLAGERLELQLDNRLLSLNVPKDKPATVGISQLQVDPRTDRFSAFVVAPAQHPHAVRVAVSGQVHRLVEVPVPARRILRGDIVGARDLEMVEMRRSALAANTIVDPADLVGLSAKQTLAMGRAVGANAVQPPVLVKKGGLVTVKLEARNMVLTARGRAMESGGLDDVIRIQNMQSNRVFEAVVTGAGEAAVSLPSQVALQ